MERKMKMTIILATAAAGLSFPAIAQPMGNPFGAGQTMRGEISRSLDGGRPAATRLRPMPLGVSISRPRLIENSGEPQSDSLGLVAAPKPQERGALPTNARGYDSAVAPADANRKASADAAGRENTAPQARLTAVLRQSGSQGLDADSPVAPWGVQVDGDFSKEKALGSYAQARQRFSAIIGDRPPVVISTILRWRGTRAFYQVRVAAPSRAAAVELCNRIHSAGGSCVVLRS
jgi:hypothetical protein